MSIARHHAEWLSLVPVSGPFLSLPVLLEAFNAGLEPLDPGQSRFLRQEYGIWQESLEKRRVEPALHNNWIKFILQNTLELDDRVLVEGQAISQSLQVEIPEHHEFLRPNIVVVDPGSANPRMLFQTYPRSQELTSYVAGSRWKASPDTRMTELLHATGVRLGLVTNGEHWMLVDAPNGETTGYASWYASLWLDEPITLRAFRSLLCAGRFFNVPDDQTLEALLTKSASNQQEVTEQLGYQVRRAVEVLINSLDRSDQDFDRELLAGVKNDVLYESALTVMMRLVFLFCAEERELIPSKPFPVYEQNYSVSTISKQLRELADEHGEELLERRYDAWPRLLAAFRAVYGGLRHDDVHIPAYGGKLFNPDRFPFLEGRKLGTSWRDTEASPLPVNNRTVLHLLEALQMLQIKVPGGGPAEARRLSFRALDIEQIGHVYEGLLDHTAKRASEPFLGLAGTRNKEPEVALSELEKMLEKGESDLIKFLKEETGKSENAIKKGFGAGVDLQDVTHFRTACQGDDSLWQRVRPFAGLVRQDNFGYPVVIPTGSVFVTAGTDRRSSGTHYTPRSLTEPIVQYTLEPLVYFGPAEGLPKNEWKLKSAKELLDLKICDMACGSGAFLVQAARYMAERLLEAWDEARLANPSVPDVSPEGTPSLGKVTETLIPDDPDERRTYAMRMIAQRCLYGVDKNHLATEMAKLSLWLLTLAKDKPFEFLDHSIRCGDSLVGIHDIEQLREFSLKRDDKFSFKWPGEFEEPVDAALNLRLKLEDLPSNTVEDVERQERLLREANEKMARLRCAADLLVAAEFWGENPKDKVERVRHAAVRTGYYVEKGPTDDFERVAAKERRGQSMFHWPMEFPEVFVKRGGFDAFVGNPPFMGGSKITIAVGVNYRDFIVEYIACGRKGKADLCVYFLIRASSLLREQGIFGLVLSTSVAEGDARQVGLGYFLASSESKARIVRANASTSWPGGATVTISEIWLRFGEWKGSTLLDGVPVVTIAADLTEHGSDLSGPMILVQSIGPTWRGTEIKGPGFVLSESEARALLHKDPKNHDVIFKYISGEDVNSDPRHLSDRWVINFHDWDREKAEKYYDCFQITLEKVKPYRDTITKQIHEPDFWKLWDKRLANYSQLEGRGSVLAISLVTKHVAFAFVPTGLVYSNKVQLFSFAGFDCFSVLQSTFQYIWAWRYSPRNLSLLAYSPIECVAKFPFPKEVVLPIASERPIQLTALLDIGERYSAFRSGLMIRRREGLTKTYNRFHDSEKTEADIQKLRDLHVEMDQAVAAAYGWANLALGHGFHETKQGVRFTISEPARREVLQRLLKLNHERYAEEVAQGLHRKKVGKIKKAPVVKSADTDQHTLF